MTDPRIEKLARLVVEYSVDVQEGDLVMVQGAALAEPLLAAIVAAVTRRGGTPYPRIALEGIDRAFLQRANDDQLDWLPPFSLDEMNTIDARISTHSTWNTREMTGVDPERAARRATAMRPVMERFMARSASEELRWCVTAFPCSAFAQDADMALGDYEDFVYGAGWLDLDDPVSAWRAFGENLEELARRLAQVHTIRLVSEHTDLTVGVGGRHWRASRGLRNFPDGEVFTGPVETQTNGTVAFSYPLIVGGRELDGVRLTFENGRVVKSEARTGQEFLQRMLEVDPGASVLGEFAIGTNYRVRQFTRQILFDEKIGGTCHMALGMGYPDTGSVNQSAIHWDIVRDLRGGGEIMADGEVIYRDGEFLASFFDRSLTPPSAG